MDDFIYNTQYLPNGESLDNLIVDYFQSRKKFCLYIYDDTILNNNYLERVKKVPNLEIDLIRLVDEGSIISKEIIPNLNITNIYLVFINNSFYQFIESINILSKIEIDSIMGKDSYETKNDNQDSLFIMTNNSSINIETNNISNYNLYIEENQNQNKSIYDEKYFTFIGICDGHGDQGKTISNYLANRIPVKVKNYLDTISYSIFKDNFSEEIEPNIKSIFQEISTRLNSMQSIDTSYSGSCFCSLLISPSSIISINVGNSKAIIGIQNNNSDENTYIPYNLNYEHTSLIQNEKERIINNGGYVLYEKDEYDREYGPLKVWKKDSLLPGLLPTRTFGDKESSSIGIISEPEIQYFEMKDNFKFIVVGSNGLWSIISCEEWVQIISKYYLENDIHDAVNKIMNIAKSRWIEQKEEINEDISIIVGFLKEFKK